jgi:hypothetical protein
MGRVARQEAGPMTTLALGLLASALLAAAPEPAADPKPGQPIVVAKGDGFVVHTLGEANVALALIGQQPATAPLILHTALPSGRLTVLFRSGTTVGFPIPMGINRIPYSQTRVVGVAADTERLYVLVWSAEWKVLDRGGAGAEVKPPASDAYAVRVFWLADGSEVGSFAVGGEKRPKTVPRESMEAGPLAVEKAGGVSVYEETFRFKGKERVK